MKYELVRTDTYYASSGPRMREDVIETFDTEDAAKIAKVVMQPKYGQALSVRPLQAEAQKDKDQ